ncbi:MAG: DUF1684 domain-containing protein [Bacteroidales bacterium]|nr:DUF1684 domain-containing protein [Bacteroidales bacterium]
MRLKAILISLILMTSSTAGVFSQTVATGKNYRKEILKERKKNDRDFKQADNSPLDPKYKTDFKGLEYFSIAPEWILNATLVPYTNPDTIKMKTTTERLPLYLVYGKAYFLINGKEFNLTVFRNISLMTKPGYEDYLFVPFTDQTSGNESYGGGRYIDSRITEGNQILIDFNKAYNPYCVYSKKYSCPIPPAENYLDIRVTAGVKDFHHK